MTENKSDQEPTITSLNEEQKNAVLDDLNQRGATFFTWKTLQDCIKRFGPKARVADVQQALKNKPPETKQ